MPFAVIETVNDNASNKLSVVPDKWLRSSKSGSIVLWPNTTCSTEQDKYFRDENMCPQKSWLKYKCKVIRYPIDSFKRAMGALEALSGDTEIASPDAGYGRKRPRNDQDSDGSHKIPAMENENNASVECKADLYSPTNKNEVLRHNEAPLAVNKTEKDSLPVIISAYSEVNSENIDYVVTNVNKSGPAPAYGLGADNSLQKCLDKMNEILGLQHLMNARLDQLEAKITDLSDQNISILSSAKNCCKRSSSIEETLSFVFEPMENEQQLMELEKKLEENVYRTKLIKWLRLNISGSCPEDRMLGVLDALFTKKFQTMCTWTGISRKGPKTAVMPNRNILEIFQIIGSGDKDEVSQRELASFFMKKLKNSLKRLHLAGLRRATRHIRRCKTIKQQKTDLCDNTDESSSQSEADPESYTGYIDESGSSEVDVQQHSAPYPDDIPSTSVNNHNAFSIVKIE